MTLGDIDSLERLLASDDFGTAKNRRLREHAEELLVLARKQILSENRRKTLPCSWIPARTQKLIIRTGEGIGLRRRPGS